MKRWILITAVVTIIIAVSLYFILRKPVPNTELVELNPIILIDPETEVAHYQLYKPSEIKLDKKGNVYILDSGNNRIVVYDHNLKFLRYIGRAGQGPGEMIEPTDFDLGKEGNIYIADPRNSRITILDNNGNPLNTIVLTISYPFDLHLAVNSQGMIYVNTLDSLITVFSRDGKILNSFGKTFYHRSITARRLWNIVSLDCDPADNLWVIHNTKPLLKKFTKDGNLIFKIKINGPEIKERKKQERPMPLNGLGRYVYYFTDIFCSYGDNIFAGAHDYIYEFNPEGILIKRYRTTFPEARRENRWFFIHGFYYDNNTKIFWGISMDDGFVFQLKNS